MKSKWLGFSLAASRCAMRRTRPLIQWLIVGGLFLGSVALARAQVYAGAGTCFDGTTAYGTQQQVAATCLARACSSGYAQSHGLGSQCGSPGTGNNANAAMQATMNQLGANIDEAVGLLLRKAIFGDPAAKAAADAAAEAEREQQVAALKRQQALEEQQRQAMFERLRSELKMSAFGDMQLKDFDNSGGEMQLKGFGDSASNTDGGGMQLKGFGNANVSSPPPDASAANGGATGGQTCFFGECGPQNPDLSEPIEAWNDPMVVDLRDVQQGVDLAGVATKAPPADQQAIMDQALNAANGDQSIQFTVPSDNAVPVMSEQGLLAFQQANNAYRQAHDSAYQLQQSYQLSQQREAAVSAVVTESEQQLEADLRANIDQMTLEQKQLAMAQIFDAALQQDLAYGKTWAQYLAARQRYYQDRYDLQMYLWNTALGKQGNPPPVPPQLTQTTAGPPASAASGDASYLQQVQIQGATQPQTLPGPPDSDLNLVLPLGPTVAPTKEDLSFLEQVQSPDSITQQVLDSFRKDEAAQWSQQAALSFPPNLVNLYDRSPQFQQQVNVESKAIYAQQQQVNQAALHDAETAWSQKLSGLQNQGIIQAGIPLAQQAQSNPQLAAQLAAAQKQITAELDYKVTRAQYEAQRQWQQWIEQQEAAYKPPVMSAIAAARD